MSLFSNLVGKKYEDLSTEVLVYLLSKEYGHKRFRNEFLKLLGVEPSNEEIEFKTQFHTSELGRPDIIGIGRDTLIIIENKLFSPLSGWDQLIRYTNIFNSEKSEYIVSAFKTYKPEQIKKRIFSILAPTSQLKKAIDRTNQHICETLKITDKIQDYCRNRSITFIDNLKWETVNEILNEEQLIEKELKHFINEYLEFELSDEEYNAIKLYGLDKGNQIERNMKTSLNIFSQELTRNGIQSHSIPYASEDIYFPIEIAEGRIAYFGYFKKAHLRCNDSIFFLEIKDNIDCSLFEEENLKCFGLDGSSPDFFVCFDFNSRDKWLSEMQKIIEILKHMSGDI